MAMPHPITAAAVALPPEVRGPLYMIYGILGLALGATQVGFSAAGQGQPVWLTVILAVYAFVGTGIGFTAASNTPATSYVPERVDYAELDGAEPEQPDDLTEGGVLRDDRGI